MLEVLVVIIAGSGLFLLTLIGFVAAVYGLTAETSTNNERGTAFFVLWIILAVWITAGVSIGGWVVRK